MKLPFLNHAPATHAPARPADLGWDFHNHLLPGVDDGMADFEQARQAITALQQQGYSGAVMTPHIFKGVFNNGPANLTEAYAGFLERLRAEHVNFPVHLAAEYYADEHMLDAIKREDLLYVPVGKERWVLLEFPANHDGTTAPICVAALAARGYRPVIAHVERYPYVAKGKTVWMSRLERAGAILQGNIGSLAGQYGSDVRNFAHWLMDREMIQIWGTDLHKPEHVAKWLTPGLAQLASPGRLNRPLDLLAAPTAPKLLEHAG